MNNEVKINDGNSKNHKWNEVTGGEVAYSNSKK